MPPDLQHAFDDEPGFSRRRAGKGFAYRDLKGRPVLAADRSRIAKLAIPPAWEQVWICPDATGHIQATGRDARGRKQYIYHPDWRAWREETKFLHILEFAAALPVLRARVTEDLKGLKPTRERVLAAAVRILEHTLIRVGNDEYAEQNGSFGLTTLRNRHVVDLGGETIHFKFRGKHGKLFDTSFEDRRVAAVLRRVDGLPGQQLLQFQDEAGEVHRLSSEDVNAYIRTATGGEFSAKDFRTWAATVLAALALRESGEGGDGQKGQKSAIRTAIERVATRLGNTPTVCRQSYVHPEIIEGYLDGTLAKILAHKVDEAVTQEQGLSKSERAVLRFLERRIAEKTKDAKKTETLSAALKNSLAA